MLPLSDYTHNHSLQNGHRQPAGSGEKEILSAVSTGVRVPEAMTVCTLTSEDHDVAAASIFELKLRMVLLLPPLMVSKLRITSGK